MSESLIFSLFLWRATWAIRSQSLISSEQCERIAHFAQIKWEMWANRSGSSPKMSNLLTSLNGNERSWANRSGHSLKMSEWVNRLFFWANRSFAHFWAKYERFAWKSNERIPSPALYSCWFSSRLTTMTSKLHLQGDDGNTLQRSDPSPLR